MEQYDLVVVGAGTTGAYLARNLARRGHRVLVIDRLPRTKVGTKYDIFHIEEKEFARLDIPRPVRGDPAWAFEFVKNYNADPLTRFPKCQMNPMVGLHMHEYTLLLNDEAAAAGAKLLYSCAFEDFLFDGDGQICGVKAKYRGREKKIGARVVADCSGMAAAARGKLPASFGMETAPLTDEDMFYVILKYVTLNDPKDYLEGSTFWAYYKSWIAPSADPHGAIIGLGACHSFDYAETVFAEMEETVPLPAYTLDHIERGRTPYTRHPHTLVADRFLVSGDAGNLTKSVNGEGVTSSMVQLSIAVETLDRALRLDRLDRAYLWDINVKYNAGQGAEFAFLRALLVGVVNAADFGEFQYAFESGIISDELLNAMSGQPLPPAVLAKAAAAFVSGVLGKRIRVSTVKAALAALKNALEISALYKEFPKDPAGFSAWCEAADALWARIGKIR